MARKTVLREATKDDAPRPPMTLVEAVEHGTHRDVLVAQRRDIAAAIPEEKGPAKAALHRQLALLSKELEEMDAKERQEVGEGDLQGDASWDAAAI